MKMIAFFMGALFVGIIIFLENANDRKYTAGFIPDKHTGNDVWFG